MDIVTDRDYMHQRCREVNEDDPVLETAEMLFKELEEHNALGLAANQLRVPLRMFVMRMTVTSNAPMCIANPVITKKRGSDTREERCLSAEATVRVERPKNVTVKGVNQYFRPIKYKFTGLGAHIICHEIDHLNGKLITDVAEEARTALMKELKAERELQEVESAPQEPEVESKPQEIERVKSVLEQRMEKLNQNMGKEDKHYDRCSHN